MIFHPFVRNPYNYDVDEASILSGLRCTDESRTKQSFTEEADINTIVRRFNVTGQLPNSVRAPTYGDFTEIPSYHEALTAIAQANEAFEQMPATVRARFHNDPAAFVDFCSNEANRAEAEKMGLLVPNLESFQSLNQSSPTTDSKPGTDNVLDVTVLGGDPPGRSSPEGSKGKSSPK